MLNSKLRFSLVALLSVCYCCVSQTIHSQDTTTYITYKLKNMEYHELEFYKDEVFYNIPRSGMFPEMRYRLGLKKQGNVYEKIPNEAFKTSEPLIQRPLIGDMESGTLHVISEHLVVLKPYERPYFKKSFTDSIIKKNHTVFMVNGKELILSDTINFREQIDPLLENPKRPKIRVIDGKEGYEKYGVIGIKGVVEFYDRGCKKKKKKK